MIFYSAYRNLVRNRKNSLIIFALLSVVTLIFFLGNSILTQLDAGLEKSYVENYTGHLVIRGASDESFSLFGANKPSIGEFFPIPLLKNTGEVERLIEESDVVDSSIKQVSGQAVLDISGRRYSSVMFGLDWAEYGKFFTGLDIIAGAFPAAGTEGALMTEAAVERIGRETGTVPEIGDPLLFTTAGTNGFKIREIPLAGIYSYKSGEPALENLVLADAGTVRALNSIVLGTSESADVAVVPEVASIDELFSMEEDDLIYETETVSSDNLFSSLSDIDISHTQPLEGGWNFILLKINEAYSLSSARKKLESAFQDAGLDVYIMDWREAAGMEAIMIRFVQLLYNAGFFLIVVAGVIAIVNILIISIYEREGEIGTLRAIGATKSYVRKLIIIENLILALAAAAVAVICGGILSVIINSREISLGNSVLRTLFGGDVLTLTLDPTVALISGAASVCAAFLSLLYPLKIALNIRPATAMAGR